VQALDASTSSSSSYVPTQLATALNYTYHTPHHAAGSSAQGHTHLTASKQGLFVPSEGTVPSVSLPNLFLGQTQPGFPASCFRVKGHSVGPTTAITATTITTTTTVSSTGVSEGTVGPGSSYSGCLGPDWPDLGITLGNSNKTQSRLVPVIAGAKAGEGKPDAVDDGTSSSGSGESKTLLAGE